MADSHGFTAGEICSIIRACKESRVISVKAKDLCITFSEDKKDDLFDHSAPTYLRDSVEGESNTLQKMREETERIVGGGSIEPQLTPDQMDQLRQLQLEELQLDDPVAYESHIIDGLLEGSSDA